MKLRRIGQRDGVVRKKFGRDVDVGGNGGPDQLQRLGDQLYQVGRLFFAFRPPAETQYLLHQRFGATGGVDYPLQSLAGWNPVVKIGQGKFGIPHDGAEDVVEIVRYTARQRAQRLHLLRLPELRFQPQLLFLVMFSLGQVGHGDEHARKVLLIPGDHGFPHNDMQFVASQGDVGGLTFIHGGALGEISHLFAEILEARFGFQLVEADQQILLAIRSVQVHGGLVNVDDFYQFHKRRQLFPVVLGVRPDLLEPRVSQTVDPLFHFREILQKIGGWRSFKKGAVIALALPYDHFLFFSLRNILPNGDQKILIQNGDGLRRH